MSDVKIITNNRGRKIAYSEFGDPKGVPVFYAHGSPGSQIEAVIFHDEALKLGFRIIAVNRPGIGKSEKHTHRTLLDYPKDVELLANSLCIDKFGLIGWSGGGIFTLASAYKLSNRVLFTIVLASYTHLSELKIQDQKFSNRLDRIAFMLTKKYPVLLDVFMKALCFQIKYLPKLYIKSFKKSLSLSDRAVLNNSVSQLLVDSSKECVAQGSNTLIQDTLLHYQNWGFLLRDIKSKVVIFHGPNDTIVPLSFGKHLNSSLPNSELFELPAQGHLFPVNFQKLILTKALNQIDKTHM